ncbi:MAG: hypothetical protein ACYTBJ_06160 [Planctomycetota bacterium]|jgi:hypothetical protein
MSAPVIIPVDIDTSRAMASIDNLQARIDTQAALHQEQRTRIMRELAVVNQALSIVSQTAMLVARATGQAVNAIFRSLLQTVQGTISAILAVAAGYAATGVLGGVAAALAGFATGLSTGTAIRVLQTELEMSTRFANIEASLRGLEAQTRGFQMRGF